MYYVFIVLIIITSNESKNLRLHWSYEDEATWPGHHCQQGGARQSPIDIQSNQVVVDSGQSFITNGDIATLGYDVVLVDGYNNGHTIQFTCEEDEKVRPRLTGGPLHKKYILEQIHFHWLSEHSIDGEKFPLEVHFVHVVADTPVSEALKMTDGLAIIAVFGIVVKNLTPKQQEVTKEIDEQLTSLTEPGSRTSGILMNMTKLLGDNLDEYYTYAGSLTSPECNEAVTWIIMDKPVVISEALFQKFHLISEGRQNFRRTQLTSQMPVYRRYGMWKKNEPKVVTVYNSIIRRYKYLIKQIQYLMNRKRWYKEAAPSWFQRLITWNWKTGQW